MRCDANNLLSQLWTWLHGDISHNPVYNGNFEAALGAIKARTIVAPVDNDRYFPPADSEYEAQHIRGAKCHVNRAIRRRYDHRAGLGAARPLRRAGHHRGVA